MISGCFAELNELGDILADIIRRRMAEMQKAYGGRVDAACSQLGIDRKKKAAVEGTPEDAMSFQETCSQARKANIGHVRSV